MNNSRIKGLYRLTVGDRIRELEKRGWLTPLAAQELLAGRQFVTVNAADKMIENVLGVFGLPFGIAPNFIVNGKEHIVPLVVEEPSIVAGLSAAAALARATGGFAAILEESLLAGQIYVTGVRDPQVAIGALRSAHDELQAAGNAIHPRLIERGGGVRRIEVRAIELPDGSAAVALHLLVDTGDAMGANLVNSICEAIAPRVAEICDGEIALRILSNLVDQSVCTTRVRYPVDALATDSLSGIDVRDRIVLANDIALVDPHRAATHNKGIMNGIDALAIATGNDWRAIEAGAHAYAAKHGRYSALTRWFVTGEGDLGGEISIPLKPGIVGGTLAVNRAAAIGLEIAAVDSARELAELMAAVGLAQNFAALKALATNGIQHGHMRLHARGLAAAAGASDADIDAVVDALVSSGEIKDWKAAEIVARFGEYDAAESNATDSDIDGSSAGKIILLGEHAVVYGYPALAIPIPNAVRVAVSDSDAHSTVHFREWHIKTAVSAADDIISRTARLIMKRLDVEARSLHIEVSTSLPRGMGLGSSAAIVVAIVRGIATHCALQIDDTTVNAIAFECELIAHGTPSGVDNTLSCYGHAMLFQNSGELKFSAVNVASPLPIVIGLSHQRGATHDLVAGVRERREQSPSQFDAVFAQIGALSEAGSAALEAGRLEELGALMNVNQGLLNAIGVSTPELEQMVVIARENGALGAKLTGAGGGGAIVALCPGAQDPVTSALNLAGFKTLPLPNEQEA